MITWNFTATTVCKNLTHENDVKLFQQKQNLAIIHIITVAQRNRSIRWVVFWTTQAHFVYLVHSKAGLQSKLYSTYSTQD